MKHIERSQVRIKMKKIASRLKNAIFGAKIRSQSVGQSAFVEVQGFKSRGGSTGYLLFEHK